MADQIKLRRDSSLNWGTVNPTLGLGEVGIITDKAQFKVGNGSTAFNSLPTYDFIESGSIGIVSGSGANSIVQKGGNNQTISEGTIALGSNNTVGSKGYYWSSIDIANKKITLSSTQTTTTPVNCEYSVTDPISITDYAHYDMCSIITAIDGSVITVDKLPFTGLEPTPVTKPDDWHSVFCVNKPNIGAVNFGAKAYSEGGNNKAVGGYSHAEGWQNIAGGKYSHVEGRDNKSAYGAHTEGVRNSNFGRVSHAEGYENSLSVKSKYSHIEGANNVADAEMSHTEGYSQENYGNYAHAEGYNGTITASGSAAHVEGTNTTASKDSAHAEGYGSTASGAYAHSENYNTTASGTSAHAEGNATTASGSYSHAEGSQSQATKDGAHAEGGATHATNNFSHAEGYGTYANGLRSHAEGNACTANGHDSHAEGKGTVTNSNYIGEHAEGQYNKSNIKTDGTSAANKAGSTQHSVGIGTGAAENLRKNAFEIMQNGDIYVYGKGGYNGTNAGQTGVKTLQQILTDLGA